MVFFSVNKSNEQQDLIDLANNYWLLSPLLRWAALLSNCFINYMRRTVPGWQVSSSQLTMVLSKIIERIIYIYCYLTLWLKKVLLL